MDHKKVRCHLCGWCSHDGFAMRSEIQEQTKLDCPQCRGIGSVTDAVCPVDNCWNFMPCPLHGEQDD